MSIGPQVSPNLLLGLRRFPGLCPAWVGMPSSRGSAGAWGNNLSGNCSWSNTRAALCQKLWKLVLPVLLAELWSPLMLEECVWKNREKKERKGKEKMWGFFCLHFKLSNKTRNIQKTAIRCLKARFSHHTPSSLFVVQKAGVKLELTNVPSCCCASVCTWATTRYTRSKRLPNELTFKLLLALEKIILFDCLRSKRAFTALKSKPLK